MTMMTDERLKILQMLEEGKITAEEASALLRALGGGRRASPGGSRPGGEGHSLRIHVTDMASGSAKVNVMVPMSLVSAGLHIAGRFAPELEGFDMQELEEVLGSGTIGKIVEVIDEEDSERVEIYVE